MIKIYKYARHISKKGIYKLIRICEIFFFIKLSIRSKNRLIRGDQSHRPYAGARSKPKFCSVWTCASKLTHEGIEPETLRGTHSKIPNQSLGQPQMSYICEILLQPLGI